MPSWEYDSWLLEREEVGGGILRTGERRWKNFDELQVLGEQGWELVSVVPTRFGGDIRGLQDQFWAFFKRPRHNGLIETSTQEALSRGGPIPKG